MDIDGSAIADAAAAFFADAVAVLTEQHVLPRPWFLPNIASAATTTD